MTGFRFSIASLMAVVLVSGLGFASLRINSPLCATIILLITLVVLCGAVLMAVARTGPGRLAWIGCAVFGWSCFIVGFWPAANDRLGSPHTTALFEESIPYLNPYLDSEIKKYPPPAGIEAIGYSEYGGNVTGLQRYRQSSHSVLTLCFAALGFVLGYTRAARDVRASGVGRQPEQVTDRF